MGALEWSIAITIFGAVFCLCMTFFTAFIARKNNKRLEKTMEPMYKEEALESKSLFHKLGRKFNESDYGKEIEDTLVGADIKLTPSQWMLLYIAAWASIAILFSMVMGVTFPFNILIGYLIVKILSRQFFKFRQNKLATSVNGQLPEVNRMLASSIRAGMSIQQGIDMVAKEISEPTRSFYQRISSEIQLGTNLDVVLERITKQVNSKDLRLMTSTIITQRKAGGDLGEALDHLAKTLEERERINQELINNTAESRYIAIVLILLPVFMILMFSLVFEGFLMPLFTIPGLLLAAAVVLIMIVGYLLVRSIATIRV